MASFGDAGRVLFGKIDDRFALAFVIGLPTILLLCLPLIPLTDLPEHTLAIQGMQGALFGHPGALEANFRTSPYLAYHMLGAVLAEVFGSADISNRVLIGCSALAFPLSLRRALLALGAAKEIAWFGVLPFFCRALSIGFLPFMASVPIGLFLLSHARSPCVDVRDVRPAVFRSVLLACAASLLFYSHISTFSIFVPAALLVGAADRWREQAPAHTGAGHVSRLKTKVLGVVSDSAWVLPAALLALRFVLVGRLSAAPGEGLDDAPPTTMNAFRSLHAFPCGCSTTSVHAQTTRWLCCIGFCFSRQCSTVHVRGSRLRLDTSM
jgi:hypothetical protein